MSSSTRRLCIPAALRLLGGFQLIVDGAQVRLPVDAQRVLGYLALVPPGQPAQARPRVAECLWLDASKRRSMASLRTALWRIRQVGDDIVHASRGTVWLDERVEVDVRRRLHADPDHPTPCGEDIDILRGDLLPGWQDDWLLLERERIRQLQLRALEAISRRLCKLGRYAEAADAAYAAIAGEPLRESAHAVLIDVFLAEGDVAQARRQLRCYADMLWTELAVRPSAALVERVAADRSMAFVPVGSARSRPAQPPS